MTAPLRLFDRYVLGIFIRFLLFSLLAAAAIFVVVDLIEHLDSFIDKKVSYPIVALYYLYFLPFIIYLVLPVAALLSSLFTVGNLSRTHELTAMKASGIGLYRILYHLLIIGLLLSAGNFFFGETIVPVTNKANKEINNKYMSGGSGQAGPNQIYLRNHPGEIVHMDNYDSKTSTAYHLDWEKFDGDTMVQRLSARQALWRDSQWIVVDGEMWTFKPSTSLSPVHDKPFPDLGFQPSDLVMKAQANPEEMGYWQLRRYVNTLRDLGGDPQRWIVDLAFKTGMPITCAIVILLGVPIAAQYRRAGIVLSFGLGLLISFLYFALQQIGRVMGYNGELGPQTAAWMGNLVFMVVGILLYLRVRK